MSSRETTLDSSEAKPSSDLRYILASGSKRRRDIMALAGMVFVVQSGAGNPTEVTGEVEPDVVKLTQRNAATKLDAAVAASRNRIPWNTAVIAADTVVSLDGHALGKPDSREIASRMLLDLRGRKHEVVTTVALTYAPFRQQGTVLSHTVTSGVHMRRYSDGEIEAYIATGIPYDRAGAYGVQDATFDPAESVIGCYLNVVGLPLCAVRAMLPSKACRFAHAHIYANCAAHEERVSA